MEQESTHLKTGHDTKPQNKDFGSEIRIQVMLINWRNYKYRKLHNYKNKELI